MTVIAKNPILEGFYPDPSFCQVDGVYYMVNSTFAYFPGLPVSRSKDLAHWEQIGNVLTRKSQIPLEHAGHSQGLFAPTIRYHKGTFYCICTNVSHGGNFIVTTNDIEGEWSDPYYLEGADGIDPSLFFDEDDRCYYIGTHPNPEGVKYNGDWYIWIQELDLKTMKLIGEKKDVWNGALKNCIWPEGPHLYHFGEYYYIMHAEGGTGPEHCISICRSKELWGPYENCPRNPIITHRHLGVDYPIKYVGHGDIVETPNHEWYMVMLAVRPLERFTTMGRETFLAKFTWENEWPVVNPGIGILTDTVEIDLPEAMPEGSLIGTDRTYSFANMSKLSPEFLLLRNPKNGMYRLTEKGLELSLSENSIKELESPSYVGVRQTSHHFVASAKVDISDLKGQELAGLCLLQSNEYHLRLEATEAAVAAILCQNKEDTLLGAVSIGEETDKTAVCLSIRVEGLMAYAELNGRVIGEAKIQNLSTEVAGGFVGCTVGMLAKGNDAGKYVAFQEFAYKRK